MAQKSKKTLAQKNTQTLNRTHLIALGVNATYVLLALFFRKRSIWRYVILNLPALIIEFWFEFSARPTYIDEQLKKSGEDLEAKGLTEWMWDVVYWTWGNVVFAGLVGDWAWWLMLVPLAYSVWLAVTTFTGMRQGLGGMMGQGQGAEGQTSGGQSKRQAKLEARGGQKVRYR